MIKSGSSLLRWTTQGVKSSKNGGKPNWIHQPEALQGGHVVYLVKFLGNTEVDQPKGIVVVKEGIRKLKFNQHLKRAEGTKTPKVELTISVDGVAIQDPKTKKISHQYPLHRISYCADDKGDPKFFSFIAKEADNEKHNCFVFVSEKLAEEITLTIGQAFDLAYQKFLQTSGRDLEMKKQIMMLHKRVQELEAENSQLRVRLNAYENSSKSRSSIKSTLPSVKNQAGGSNGAVQPKLQPLQPPPSANQLRSLSRNNSANRTVNLLDIETNIVQPTVGRKLENLSLDDNSFDFRLFEASFNPPLSSFPLSSSSSPSIGQSCNLNSTNGSHGTTISVGLNDSSRHHQLNNNSSHNNGQDGSKNGHLHDVNYQNGNEEKDVFGFAPFNPEKSDLTTGTDPFGMGGPFEAKELEQAIGAIDKKLAEMRDGFTRGLSFGNGDFNGEALPQLS